MNIKLLLCLALALFTCSPNKPVEQLPDSSYAGMHKIAAEGKIFIQGAADAMAKSDEKPIMKSSFNYDYWLDATEVTQKDYYEVTGKKPVKDTSAYGVGDAYPVYNVTWYDAILYCNAKSRKLGLDTVYTYYGLDTSGGSVRNAATVIIDYTKKGFRLPTEAEWEYAAREGTSAIPFPHQNSLADAESYAWFAPNSNNKTHPVAMLKPNSFGLYDIAGNVFEWTNDWKTTYCLDTIGNSVGAPEDANTTEKVVKGGAYNSQLYGQSSIRPSARSLVYTTVLSTTAEYIGFRCARGVISPSSYVSTSVVSTTTNPSYITISNIQSIFSTTHVKLAYVNCTNNKRTLCTVNFALSNAIREWHDFTNVYLPVISPNGQYIAWCTRDIGSPSGNSHIYIRNFDSLNTPPVCLPIDSAFAPRWWVDPTSKDTFLIFTNYVDDNTAPKWSSTKTFMIQMAGDTASWSTNAFAIAGSFHGGRSVNGEFIVSGYKSLLLGNLFNNTYSKLFVYPHNGKAAGASDQVCNVSMSPDGGSNGTSLFLDFGYSGISSITGGSYGVHACMFTVNANDSITAWYGAPAGEDSWDYPKWSNAGRFAIACARNPAGASHALYTVNLETSQYTHIIEGTDLSQPCLWVDPLSALNTDNVDLDSLGQYNSPAIHGSQIAFMSRIKPYWQHCSDMNIVFIGSSHTSQAVDPKCITGNFNVYNMSMFGCEQIATGTVLNDYLLNHSPSLKLIGMDVILGKLFFKNGDNVWQQGMVQSKGYNYDKSHNFWVSGFPANFFKLVAMPTYKHFVFNDSLGLVSLPCGGWGTGIPPMNQWYSTCALNAPNYLENINTIKSWIRTLESKKIHLLMYITPESPNYKNTDHYGLEGPTRAAADTVIRQLKALEDSSQYFHFYDANQFGDHDYTTAEAFDQDHLCPVGAAKFSHRIDSLVHVILKE